ncbi:tyrosine-type recombinase/integrase [Tsukamurella soli]|uniref:Core-binding (CB) domain-containing protein n=1 Tax=Tsukamurella soli TaxID=644556 RepID=A0ABP8J2L2_9ACTN
MAPAAGKLPLRDATDAWLADQHHLAPSTYSRYRSIAEGTVTARFGHLPLSKVTRPLIRKWIGEQVDADVPAETVHKNVGVLRRILGQAVEDGRLASNPALKVKLPPITTAEMRFLTLVELRALAEAAGTDAPAIWVLGVCGLRIGELIGLQHKNLDRRGGLIHVVRSVTVVDNKHVVVRRRTGSAVWCPCRRPSRR